MTVPDTPCSPRLAAESPDYIEKCTHTHRHSTVEASLSLEFQAHMFMHTCLCVLPKTFQTDTLSKGLHKMKASGSRPDTVGQAREDNEMVMSDVYKLYEKAKTCGIMCIPGIIMHTFRQIVLVFILNAYLSDRRRGNILLII